MKEEDKSADNTTDGITPLELSEAPVFMVETAKLKIADQPMPELEPGIRLWLEDSIKEFGIKIPLIISTDGTILDGRNRYAIAKKLNIAYVKCTFSDTMSNPLEQVLKYDLELGRRAILPHQRSKLIIERDKYRKECETDSIKRSLSKIVPQMHETVKKIYEESRDISLVMKIAAQPHEVQEAFIKEVVVMVDDRQFGDVSDEIRRLSQAEIDLKKELESIRRSRDEALKQQESIKKQFAKLQGDMKVDIENRFKDKEKELEERYKASSPEEIQRIAQKIREDVKDEYELEIYKLNKNLEELSVSLDKKMKKEDKLKQVLTRLEREKKDLALLNINLENKVGAQKNVIVGLARPDKFAKRLEMSFNDLQNTFMALTEVKFEGFDGYFTEHMRTSVDKIKDITAELEKLLQKKYVRSKNGTESPETVETE